MFASVESHSPLLLLAVLLICSVSISFSDGGSHLHHPQTARSPKFDVVRWEERRLVLEGKNEGGVQNSTLVLAEKRTRRRDPLDDFRHYKGGWNISSRHYLFSVAFTAAPLFVIAAIWFLGFGLCLCIICVRHYCCHRLKQSNGNSKSKYALSLLGLFITAAIVGSIVLFTGQEKFRGSTSSTLKYVVKQADTTVEKLNNVSDYLAAAKRVGVDQVALPPNIQHNIDKVETKINSSATTIDRKADQNSDKIQHVLNSVRLAVIIVAAMMLLLALLGFVLLVLGVQPLVSLLSTLGWILVTVTFVLCGLFLILHNAMGDTCVAMEEWIQNPTAHTSMDDILPCMDNATAQETLLQTKDVTFQLVHVVNRFIGNISNHNFPAGSGPVYFNQSGPLVPLLCNPFHHDKTDRSCADGEVNFDSASQEWRKYVCEVSANNLCTSVGRLTPVFYDQITAIVNVSYGLYYYGPFLVDLQDCSFAREAFRQVEKDYCPGLRLYSERIYVGLALVSASVMLSLVFWVVYARERRKRPVTEQFVALTDQDQSSGVENGRD
ncbi:uncharacterized protein LOC115752701 [Rhodamnia argentea]|uniref:Uncharacterized protein LOC115752701 n=1 Tax=Rhodamnia argentea TaxID=178133 RepID=A0ABM3GYM7_9MYRT|nr:uncharacterized protein LOC115752701 [Rhodamnia argentea]